MVHWSLLAMVQPKMKDFDGLDDASSCTFFSSSNRQECYRFPTPSRHPNGMDGWSCQSSHPDWWVWRINPRGRQPDARDEPTGARLVHYRAVPSRGLSQRERVCVQLGEGSEDQRWKIDGPLAETALYFLSGSDSLVFKREKIRGMPPCCCSSRCGKGGDRSRGSWFADLGVAQLNP